MADLVHTKSTSRHYSIDRLINQSMETVCSGPLQSKKVCIVGAGMAGLITARELRREGHAVTVMEQRHDIGGQWLYDPRTDDADPLGVAAPVKVHSSMYASVRLIGPRECMGVSDFQFLPRRGVSGRDLRRFPEHQELFCYLKDFCDAFRLMDVVRLNTKVVRVVMAQPPSPLEGGGESLDMRWLVRTVRTEEAAVAEDELFDAVVVANGHYSQPRLPTVQGTLFAKFSNLRVDNFGLDIALDLCGVATAVHITAKSVEKAMTPAMSKMLANHADLHLHSQVERLCDDGTVAFANGTRVIADTVIYCTGYKYSFPFLDTGGAVTVEDNRVGPLFEHTFPPALAPLLSFVGIHRKLYVPWFFEAQGRWIASVLSGRRALPPPDEMLRAVQEYYREMFEFVAKYTDLPPMEEWKRELTGALLRDTDDDRESFRDLDDDSESVRDGVQRWLGLSDASGSGASAQGACHFLLRISSEL
ncbi:hypothetical protein EJB05_40671, partial [Eragrostis curvula]